MLLEDGGVCTIEYTNVASSQTFFRGLSPEANATFSGRDYDIVRKQPNPPPSPATTCQCLCGRGRWGVPVCHHLILTHPLVQPRSYPMAWPSFLRGGVPACLHLILNSGIPTSTVACWQQTHKHSS